jgi:hypothetical protein
MFNSNEKIKILNLNNNSKLQIRKIFSFYKLKQNNIIIIKKIIKFVLY